MGQIKYCKLNIVTAIKCSPSNTTVHNTNTTKVMANSLRALIPLFDRVLVRRLVAETSTKGGILLPESSVSKLNEGTVVAVGAGARDERGNVISPSVAVGDAVLLPEYGGTKLQIDDQELFLFRESELLGKFAENFFLVGEK